MISPALPPRATRSRSWRAASLPALLAGLLLGCGPTYIEGTRIEATDGRQEIHNLVERYRIAVQQRDDKALRALSSPDYYENGSTTDDPSDDYNIQGLEEVLEDLKTQVKVVRYEIEPTAIEVYDNATATYDYRFNLHYLYTAGEQDHWGNVSDENRLTFRREKGRWRIVSGM